MIFFFLKLTSYQFFFLFFFTPISSSVVAADLRRRLNQCETLDSVFMLSHPHALSRPLQPSKPGPCKKSNAHSWSWNGGYCFTPAVGVWQLGRYFQPSTVWSCCWAHRAETFTSCPAAEHRGRRRRKINIYLKKKPCELSLSGSSAVLLLLLLLFQAESLIFQIGVFSTPLMPRQIKCGWMPRPLCSLPTAMRFWAVVWKQHIRIRLMLSFISI